MLAHKICISSTLLDKAEFFSKEVVPIFTPISGILESLLLHVSVNT